MLTAVLAAFVPTIMPARAQGAAQNSTEWAAVLTAAKREGKVVLYGVSIPSTLAALKTGFEKIHAEITVEYTRITGTQLTARIDQDRASDVDGADVFVTSEGAWAAKHAASGSLKKPMGPSASAWPQSYLMNGTAPILMLEPFVMAYNTNLVKTEINGYADILKPELQGRIGITEPTAGVLIAWFRWLEETQGADFLQRLAQQKPRIYPSALPITQAAAAGEIAVAGFTVPTVTTPLLDQGAPIKVVVPSPAVGVGYTGGVLSWAKRPNAALVFMDFLMSPEGQAIWTGNGMAASPIKVPGSLNPATVQALDQSQFTPDKVAEYKRKWDQVMRGR